MTRINKNLLGSVKVLIALTVLAALFGFIFVNSQKNSITGYEIFENLNLTEEISSENIREIQNLNEAIEILNETVNETSEIMNETSYETSSEENQTLETNFTNETEEILQNETNITEDLNETAQNVTENITSASEVSNETEIISKNIKIELDYPKKIVRGGTVAVKATVSNLDVLTASNVVLLWNIPTGFQIIGDERYFCGTIEPNASCVSEITLKTDVSTSLGVNNIKVLVNYE